MKPSCQSVLLLLLLCGGALHLHAADGYVARGGQTPEPPYAGWATAASNLQDAVNAATPGATVWVSNGVYQLTNQLVIGNLTVRSYRNGALDRDGTVIDGNYPAVTNRCLSLNHAGAVVEGFTITNGYAIGNGGGVSITAGTLRHCLVTGNIATNGSAGGGGVYATGSGSWITNCDIIANVAQWPTDTGYGSGGGGVYLAGSASLLNSRVLFNRSPRYYTAGGGVNCNGGSLVANCTVISNTTLDGWGAGGVWLNGNNNRLRNCLITGSDDGRVNCGAGVGAAEGITSYLENCTVVNNYGQGIGARAATGTKYQLANTIAYYNSGGDLYAGPSGTVIASNCCLSSTGAVTSGSGNITDVPAFMQRAGGDYRLAPWSPGVDAGLLLPWMSAASDLADQPRVSANNLPDMGAYETTAGGPPSVYYVACHGQTPVSPYTNGWAAAASNLQDAVAVASDGSTILVTNGVYTVTTQVIVGYFTIRSCHDGVVDPDGTVIKGGYPLTSNRCFMLSHAGALVEGFTVTNGFVWSPDGYNACTNGGGVYMTAGTLKNCTVTGNTATNGNGGGVYATGSSCMITNCRVIANNASCNDGANVGAKGGGGLMVLGGAQVWNSLIMHNRSPIYCTVGGGIYCGAGVLVANCSIISNTTADGWTCGGVWMGGNSNTLRNCLIAGNNDGRQHIAAGVGAGNGYVTFIENCTIATNYGRGIGPVNTSAGYGCAYRLVNTIAYYNSGGDLYAGPSGTIIASNSCAASIANVTGGSGNTTNTPGFADLRGRNFRLTTNSPCFNTGTNQPWMTDAADLDGHPRVDMESGVVDMGCYELGDLTTDRYAAQNGQTPVFPFQTWATAASNIQDAVNAASSNTTVWVAPGRYTLPTNAVVADGSASVVHIDKPLTLRSLSGVPADTIIDGGGIGRGVMASHSATGPDSASRLVIDGFTVSNGYARGGGIRFNANGTPWVGIVQNCVVSGNATPDPDYAGGICAHEVSGAFGLVVSGSVIRANAGGGLSSSTAQGGASILSCRVEDNVGGGLRLAGGSNTVRNCAIRGNSTVSGGGGLHLAGGTHRLENDLVCGNQAGQAFGAAGGIYVEGCTPELYNCTIAGNGAVNAGMGGIYVDTSANVMAWNSIIVSNVAGSVVANGPPGDHGGGAGYFYLTRCCTHPLAGVIGVDNLDVSPGFVDFAGGDYRLAADSPCVDSGLYQTWMDGAVDVNGYPRVDYGDGRVDRGCYERPGYHLVRDGRPLADIVIAADPPRMVTLAATELQEYVFKITGAQLPIVTVPTPNGPAHIYVGESSHTAALGLSATGLVYDAFRMASGTNWLALLGRDRDYVPPETHVITSGGVPIDYSAWDAVMGGTWGNPLLGIHRGYHPGLGVWAYDERGSLNAVYEFLRSLGVRWYFPGALGEVLPSMQTLAVPDTNVVVRPDFAVRNMLFYYHEFFSASADEVKWQLRLGLNMGRETIGPAGLGHGILNVISRDEIKQAHPEYYQMKGGVRDTINDYYGCCLSSDGLYTQNVAFARALFRVCSNEIPAVSVMPTDGYGELCECPLCVGKSSPERGSMGKLSDYVWGYVNRVATNLLATHPEKKVTCCAYTTYQMPPTNIVQLSSNVVMGWAAWRTWYVEPAAWDAYTNQVSEWMAKLPSGQIFRYDYYLHSFRASCDGVPVYFPHLIARDLRFQKGKSLGEFIEVYRNYAPNGDTWEALAANHLNCYVTARLWWDADQDLEALLDEYCAAFYGPAAAEMRAFIAYCEEHWMAMRGDKAVMDRMLGLLAAARQAAGTGVYAQRIDLLVEYVKPIKTLSESLNDRYVAQNGQMPMLPYTNWVMAASNIQDAVDAAGTNTGINNAAITVWVGAGRYTVPTNAVNYMGSNVVYIGKSLSLRSSNGVPASTVIDGQGAYRGIMLSYDKPCPYPFVIDGLTISNGYGTNVGGGIVLYPHNSEVIGSFTCTVQNCVITHNRAGGLWDGGQGGGLYGNQPQGWMWGCVISNCVIEGNQALYGATNNKAAYGGGLYLGYGVGTVVNSSITSNTATYGGGLFTSASMEFQNTALVGNRVTNGLDRVPNAGIYEPRGAGVYSSTRIKLRNCLIARNSSCMSCGGVYIAGTGTTNELINCTVAGNESAGVSGNYGGTVFVPGGILQCLNSIVASNTPFHARNSVEGAGVTITNCCLIPTNFGSANPVTALTTNNPRFAAPVLGNYRLGAGSPCINAGSNEAWMNTARDLDGAARILPPDDGTVDLGAYEYPVGSSTVFTFR